MLRGMSAKNFPLSPAAQDLGLGDMANQQLQDQVEERRKKLIQNSQVGAIGSGISSALGLTGVSGY